MTKLLILICLLLLVYIFLKRPPQFVIDWCGKTIEDGYSNCLIFALWMKWNYGGKIVLQDTERNKLAWVVWWHVKWKPIECPVKGECLAEQAFEPIDGPDRFFPPWRFKGRVVKASTEGEPL